MNNFAAICFAVSLFCFIGTLIDIRDHNSLAVLFMALLTCLNFYFGLIHLEK